MFPAIHPCGVALVQWVGNCVQINSAFFFSSPSLAMLAEPGSGHFAIVVRQPPAQGLAGIVSLAGDQHAVAGPGNAQRPMNRRHTVGDHGGGPWAMDPAEQVAENLAGVFPASVAAGQDELVGALFSAIRPSRARRRRRSGGPHSRRRSAGRPRPGAGHSRRRPTRPACGRRQRTSKRAARTRFVPAGRVRGRPIRGPEPPCSVRCCRPNRLPPPPGNWRRGACRSFGSARAPSRCRRSRGKSARSGIARSARR